MSFVEQIFTKCISHFSYYVESDGEAVVIDPARQFNQYISMAKDRGAKITAVLLTHLPEDHVGGHVELAEACSLKPSLGAHANMPRATIEYPFTPLSDGDSIYFGSSALSVLETPGHTCDSLSFLLRQGNDSSDAQAVFSGDTLLINDVGRTDIPGAFDCFSAADSTRQLSLSLKKLWKLPDATKVYPGHGTGSVSTAFLASPAETISTIATEKKNNAPFRLAGLGTSAVFSSQVLGAQFAPPPTYFPATFQLNRAQPQSLAASVEKAMKKLLLEDIDKVCGDIDTLPTKAAYKAGKDNLRKECEKKPLILDTRSSIEFCKCHIPGSIFFGLEDGNLAPYLVTSLPNTQRPVVIVSESEDTKVPLIAERLASMGYDNILGHVARGFFEWKEAGRPVASMRCVDADELHSEISEDPNAYVIDSRKPHEYRALHLNTAVLLPLEHRTISEITRSKKVAYCYCRSGYRSVCLLSIASALYGYKGECVNVLGGFTAMAESKKFAPLLTSQEDSSLSKL